MRYFWLLAIAVIGIVIAAYHATDNGTCLQKLDGKCIKLSLVK